METRHPVDGYFGNELPSICNHCGSYGSLKSQDLEKVPNFCVLWKTIPCVKIFKILFRTFLSPHRSMCCVQISWIWPSGNRCKVVWYLPDKKNKISLLRCPVVATVRIAPNVCQGQPQTTYSECCRFHPNRFTFGGVIPERANTIKTGRKVNAIFGWSLASSRIITITPAVLGLHCTWQIDL